MLELLIISLFAYAIKEKEKEVRAELFARDITEYKITCIQALPKDIERKMYGKQFDYAYADRNYISDELGIRIPVCGMVKDDRHRTRGLFYKDEEIVFSSDEECF